MANRETFGWDWHAFQGDVEALKWNRRDLPILDKVIAMTPRHRVAVQAGGNLGIFPKRLAQTFKAVYTFEPAADLFAVMMHNAPESNILRYQAALGYERLRVGVSRIRRDGKPNAHAGITHVSGAGIIPTLRIDDLGLDICDLMYLDIEGCELEALRGGVNTIERCRPLLAIEINKNQELAGQSSTELRAFISRRGYRLVVRLTSDEIYAPVEWPPLRCEVQS